MLTLLLGILKEGDRGQVREGDLVPQLGLVLVLVDGKVVRPQYEEDGFPGLQRLV